MTMYMDGFHWSLLFNRPPNAICLNYFVSTWRIQHPSEFRGCLIYTFFLAILLEALSSVRNICVQYLQHRQERSRRRQWLLKATQHVIATILYALQTILGYLLMLIAMSYSIELFLSIIFGLIIGNILCVRYGNDNGPDENVDDNDNVNEDGDIQVHSAEEDATTETRALLHSSGRRNRTNDLSIRRRT